jgi:hypothetical protein
MVIGNVRKNTFGAREKGGRGGGTGGEKRDINMCKVGIMERRKSRLMGWAKGLGPHEGGLGTVVGLYRYQCPLWL